MLRSAKEIMGYRLAASDGSIGHCRDLLFDDHMWTIRYMGADTGRWLPGRRVVISPTSMGPPEWSTREIPIRLTRAQIEKSPPLDSDAPVSRQYEINLFEYYGWPQYWGGAGIWGLGPLPSSMYSKTRSALEETDLGHRETNLRSMREVMGYHIRATDGEIGHVDDFIFDDFDWVVRYLVADTRNLIPGRRVLLPPEWVSNVDWAGRRVKVDVSRDEIKESPRFSPSEPVNREHEVRLYDYYGRPKYWDSLTRVE